MNLCIDSLSKSNKIHYSELAEAASWQEGLWAPGPDSQALREGRENAKRGEDAKGSVNHDNMAMRAGPLE